MRVFPKLLAVALALFSVAAQAQQWPKGWTPIGNTVSVTASTSPSATKLGWASVTPLPQPPQSVVVCNQSTSITAFVALGNSSVSVTTSTGFPVMPNYCGLLTLNAAQYVIAATASSSAVLQVSSGTGLPFASLPRTAPTQPGGILLTGGTNLLTGSTDLMQE